MRKLLTSFLFVLMAMSAGATDYFAMFIGGVQLNTLNIASSSTLTSQLQSNGVLQSGTVEFQHDWQGDNHTGKLILTNAVLSYDKSTGVIWAGVNGSLGSYIELDQLEIVLNGTNSVTNTNSGGSAIYMGGTACSDFARLEFSGNGTLELHGGSSTGAGITAANRSGVSVTTLTESCTPTIVCDGFTGVRSLGSTTFQYMLGHGTFKATGTVYACMHEGITAMNLSNKRKVIDPENGHIGEDDYMYTMCNSSGNSVKTFTVGPEQYPLYVCGVQVDADNASKLTTILTNLGYLKSGTVQYLPDNKDLELYNANIEYNFGPYSSAIVSNGNHNLDGSVYAPGINNLLVTFSGNNTFGGDTRVGIDNNKANMKLRLYNGAHLTINTRNGIYHNIAMLYAGNGSGNYTFTITNGNINPGPNDPALLTINASNGYGFYGDFGQINYESGVTKFSGTQGAISFGSGAGDDVPPIKYRFTSGGDNYGFRHGETIRQAGYSYYVCAADNSEATSAEIGWVGNTYGIKILGAAITDYLVSHMSELFGNNSFANAIKFDGYKTLTFDSFGSNIVNCTNTYIPLIESNIDGLKIKSTGTNLNNVGYAGTVLKLNAPASYEPDAANRTLRLRSLQGAAVWLTCDNALTVKNGILDAQGATYGIMGSKVTSPTTVYNGTFNMEGGKVLSIGNTASVAQLKAFNLNNYAIVAPEGATWSSTAHGVVDTNGNLVAGTTVQVDTKNYDLMVGGVTVTSVNANDILGDGTCSYNATTNTLTLTNANLTANNNNLRSEIPGLTIVFNGENFITNGWDNYRSINIMDCDNVTIIGNGTVTINSKGKNAMQIICDRLNKASTTIKDVTIIINDGGSAYSGSIDCTNGKASVELTIDNANIYTSNGYINCGTLNLNNCYIAKPANGVVWDGSIVLDGSWYVYQGEIEIKAGQPGGVPGDVDGDGSVTSADITALYNYLLNGDSSTLVNGDQNNDGSITSGDVTVVYNILLGN